MKRFRVIIICTVLLLFALLLLLFRVGQINKNINVVKGDVSNLSSRIKGVSVSVDEMMEKTEEDKESKIRAFNIEYNKYDVNKDEAKVDYEIIPKEISEGGNVTLVANDEEVNTEKKGIKFIASYKYKLSDKLENYVVCNDGKVSIIESIDSSFSGNYLGDILLPKISLDVQEKNSERGDDMLKLSSKIVATAKESKATFKPDDESVSMKKESIILNIEVDGKLYKKVALEIPEMIEDPINIDLKEDIKATKDQKIVVYVQIEDKYGLIHKSYIENEIDENFNDEFYTKVFNSKNVELFKY